MERFVTKNPRETAKIAVDLAKRMKGGETVALIGELGAGKTTFAQAFAQALGVRERVQSPTFILLHEHRLPASKVKRQTSNAGYFIHADAYRGDAAQLRAIGLEEYLGRPDAVVLIEWADRIKTLLPKKRVTVRFRHLGGDRRAIELRGV